MLGMHHFFVCIVYHIIGLRYTNTMDYVEMYDKNYGVQIVELE